MAESVDSLLKIANSPVLQQFLHDCVDDLVGAKQANFSNYNSDIEWTVDDFNTVKRNIQKIWRESIITGGEVDLNVGENIQKEIRKCLEIRKDEIFEALVKEKLVSGGHNLVENVDWKLKWVLGNSKLASVREPLAQVDLHCLRSGSDKVERKSVNFEVNLEMLDLVIEELEKTSKELDLSK